jgi:hypothetical protein
MFTYIHTCTEMYICFYTEIWLDEHSCICNSSKPVCTYIYICTCIHIYIYGIKHHQHHHYEYLYNFILTAVPIHTIRNILIKHHVHFFLQGLPSRSISSRKIYSKNIFTGISTENFTGYSTEFTGNSTGYLRNFNGFSVLKRYQNRSIRSFSSKFNTYSCIFLNVYE